MIKSLNEGDRSYKEINPKSLKDDIKLDGASTENLKKQFSYGKEIAKKDKEDRALYGQAARAETSKIGEELKKRGIDPKEIKSESTVLEESFKERRQKAIELEDFYDKKFNAFCLTVSGYPVDKLQNTLEKKSAELEEAKKNLKSASKEDRLSYKVKIDYLNNACSKCKALIKRKSK